MTWVKNDQGHWLMTDPGDTKGAKIDREHMTGWGVVWKLEGADRNRAAKGQLLIDLGLEKDEFGGN